MVVIGIDVDVDAVAANKTMTRETIAIRLFASTARDFVVVVVFFSFFFVFVNVNVNVVINIVALRFFPNDANKSEPCLVSKYNGFLLNLSVSNRNHCSQPHHASLYGTSIWFWCGCGVRTLYPYVRVRGLGGTKHDTGFVAVRTQVLTILSRALS